MPSFLKVDFLRKPDPIALTKGRFIRTMLSTHAYSSAVGSTAIENLGSVIDRLQLAGDEAKCRDVNKVRARVEARGEFDNTFRNTARSIETWANGDFSKLQNTGYDVRSTARKGPAQSALAAPAVSVAHGPEGTLLVDLGAVDGAVIFELQICTDNPTLDENWAAYNQYTKANRRGIQVTGRTPGQVYWFRGRCFGSAGYGPWSKPISLRSL